MLCRWVERFHEEGKRVRIVVDSTQSARYLDGLLWTFSDTSFIPHRIEEPGAADPELENVIITLGEAWREGFDVLVCDSPVPLSVIQRYSVCVHFVLKDDEEQKQESRLLWQQAREGGLGLHHVPFAARR